MVWGQLAAQILQRQRFWQVQQTLRAHARAVVWFGARRGWRGGRGERGGSHVRAKPGALPAWCTRTPTGECGAALTHAPQPTVPALQNAHVGGDAGPLNKVLLGG